MKGTWFSWWRLTWRMAFTSTPFVNLNVRPNMRKRSAYQHAKSQYSCFPCLPDIRYTGLRSDGLSGEKKLRFVAQTVAEIFGKSKLPLHSISRINDWGPDSNCTMVCDLRFCVPLVVKWRDNTRHVLCSFCPFERCVVAVVVGLSDRLKIHFLHNSPNWLRLKVFC